MIAPATGAFVTVSDAYFTATRALSSLFVFVTVTYTVPPVATNKSFFVITASASSAFTVAVPISFPSVAASYTLTTSPASNLLTVIVSSSPVALFAVLITDAAGVTVISASYAFTVRVLSNSPLPCTLTYTFPFVFASFAI